MIRTIRKYRVLRWVNAIRRQYGLAPLRGLVKGRCMHAGGCTLSRTLNRDTTHKSAYVAVDVVPKASYADLYYAYPSQCWAHVDLPGHVARFGQDFDAGKYPELELSA